MGNKFHYNIPNSQANSHLNVNFRVYIIRGTWFIHETKYNKDNQLLK